MFVCVCESMYLIYGWKLSTTEENQRKCMKKELETIYTWNEMKDKKQRRQINKQTNKQKWPKQNSKKNSLSDIQ